MTYKTVSIKPSEVKKKWVLIDAEGQVLGRLASKVAMILRGKTKPEFTPHVDAGDNVIIINAEKIVLTGKKMTNKQYMWHTGYPGGERFTTPEKLLATFPNRVIEEAVRLMLPKNRLGRSLMKNLRVYAGPVHPHAAQQPEKLELGK
jgi:large subunit ribosomal protein L13